MTKKTPEMRWVRPKGCTMHHLMDSEGNTACGKHFHRTSQDSEEWIQVVPGTKACELCKQKIS